MALNILRKTVVTCLSTAMCLGLGMLVISDDYASIFNGNVFDSVDIKSAQARETRAERRERIKEERRLRKNKRLGIKEETPKQDVVTETVAQDEEDIKPGPKEFSEDMIGFMRVEGESTEAEKLLAQKEKEAAEKAAKEAAELAKVNEVVQEETSNDRRRKKRTRTKRKRRGEAPEETASQSQAMRPEVYTKLEEAQQLFQAKNFDAAIAVLDGLDSLSGRQALQSYEKANVVNFYAFIYYSQEKYDQAITAYQRVLQQPDLPKAMIDKTQYTLAQLHMVREDYPSAIKAFEKWFTTAEKVGPSTHATLAQAYVQVKDYDKALYRMKKTLQAAHAQGKRPREQWYEVMRFLYNQKGQTKNQLEVVKLLLKYWPKKKYWLGLASLYGELNNMDKQMQILNTLYVQGGLSSESEFVSLAQMFAASEVPYKAAKIMQKGIDSKKIAATNKNLERTGEYWRQSQEMEKALPLLEDASRKAPDGKSSERLAYIYYDLGKFKESADAASRAIAKGGLRDVNNVRMLMGQALFNVEQFDQASQVFSRVANSAQDSTQQATAVQWMDFMKREKIRIQEVKQYLGS